LVELLGLFGRRILPDVLETQLPAEENVRDIDLRNALDGVVSSGVSTGWGRS
jgi:hypothetical protein